MLEPRRMEQARVKELAARRVARGRPLEGPGSEARLQRLRSGFRRASMIRPDEVNPLFLGIAVFLAIVIGGLAWPYIAAVLGRG
ncbi:MAG TPA: hypothetical protein VF138_03715 [Caulobacteraceae bacterium]